MRFKTSGYPSVVFCHFFGRKNKPLCDITNNKGAIILPPARFRSASASAQSDQSLPCLHGARPLDTLKLTAKDWLAALAVSLLLENMLLCG